MKEENVFKQKLYPHTMPVREGLWEAIEAQLPPEQDKKRYPIFWLILFGCTAIGGALMIGTFTSSKHTFAPVQKEIAVTPGTEMNGPSAGPAASATNPTAATEITTANTSSSNQTSETTIRTPSTTTRPGTASNQPLSGESANRAPLSSGQSLSIAPGKDPQSNELYPVPDPAANTLLPFSPENPNVSNLRQARTTDFIPCSETFLAEETTISVPMFEPDPHCYTFGGYATGFAVSADIMAGPGFSIRSFEDTGGESVIYGNARNDSERKQYAWTAGARLNLHLNSGFGAKLGLSYHQAGDILDYRDSLATQSTTRIDSFWASDGTFLYADTVRIFIPGTLIKKIHNTYSQLDVPILLSYELILARSIVMINAGPVFNLTSRHRGQILDTALHPRPLAPDGTPGNQVDAYKNQLGVSFYLGAGVLFPLGSHTSAIIEPRFLYRIKPVTLPQYTLKEHRHFAGLHLGLRYHIN